MVVKNGYHVVYQYGSDCIERSWHITPDDDAFDYNYSIFSHGCLTKDSNGNYHDIGFKINGVDATVDECLELINNYELKIK